MNQADRIRACAKERFVEPARRKKQTTVEIVARDVARELGLSNRMQNTCRALQSDKFLAMAGVELLDPKRTKPTATARFRYAIKQGATGSQKPAGALASSRCPPATACREEAGASRPHTPDYTLVIPCAARKRPDAGRLLAEDGTPVHFVANPSAAPHEPNVAYRRPDDIARSSLSWRQVLQQYNETHRGRDDNPLGLLPAWQLYKDATYRYVVDQLGEANVFILSAGWGLIPAAFLTPSYDITLSPRGKNYTKRRSSEKWDDFAMLPSASSRPIVFGGGEAYVPLFCALTAGTHAERIVYHVGEPPHAPNCRCVRYETTRRTTWYYEWARAHVRGT